MDRRNLIFAAAVLFCVPAQAGGPSQVKNLILLIGDGMGPQAVGLALAHARYAPRTAPRDRKLRLEQAMKEGVAGLMLTMPYGGLVTDSAASATQLAAGRPSRSGMVGVDAEGDPVRTIVELAKEKGLATGLVSDTRVTHATPACFAAHEPNRKMEDEIAHDILEAGPDVLLSGGLRQFQSSSRSDGKDLLADARSRGYATVFTRAQLQGSRSARLLGLFSDSTMPDAIRVHQSMADPDRSTPTLMEMTAKALETLSKDNDGFFLMVEAGFIDFAGHDNDAGRLLHEMRVFDDTLGVILDWAKGRSDTLVLVTADHETGDFAFSYAKDSIPAPMELPGSAFRGRLYEAKHRSVDPEVLDRIYAQRQAYEPFRDAFLALPARERTPERLASAFNAISEFPITPEQARDILEHPEVREFREFYDGAENNLTGLLARAVAGQQGVVWGTGGHTATPVLLVAFGSRDRAALFSGVHHSTEVGGLMMDSLGLRAQARDKGTSRSRNRSAQALQASQVKLP